MKASSQLPKHPTNNQQPPINSKNMPPPNTPQYQKPSLLDKYSFEDNDLSRMSQLSFEINKNRPSENEEDWLQLSIKEITTIGKELITFYLAVKYFIEYRQEINGKVVASHKEVREVKSKLVHGSILQSEHKNLILNLKCKRSEALNSQSRKPILERLEFSILRIYEKKNEASLIAKEFVDSPSMNDQYEIQFDQFEPQKGQKAKPVAAMIFEINGAIKEELEGNIDDGNQQQGHNSDDQVSEHLDAQDNEKLYNYTLGMPQKPSNLPLSPTKNQPHTANIFDNDDEDIQSQYQDNSPLNSHRTNNKDVIQKLNELSHIIDENLQKSKNEDQAYKNYLEETSNMIENLQNGTQKGQYGSSFKKNKALNDGSLRQKKKSSQQSYTKDNEAAGLDDSNIAGDRYDYVSRIENTYFAGDKNYSQSKGENTYAAGERYDYISKVQNTNFLLDKDLQDMSFIVPNDSNGPINLSKKTNASVKKQPFLKFNQNKKEGFLTNKFKKTQSIGQGKQAHPNSSRWIPLNLAQLDSSNIRYEYNQNDISNIQQTKNMQQLIDQIQKIQQQWYQKRVLNRRSQHKNEVQIPQKQNPHCSDKDQIHDKNDYLDIQLKNFKIKFSEETFYRKLIDGLRNRHTGSMKSKEADESEKKQMQIPKNYAVYLTASEVDDLSTNKKPENACKIDIKIPSDLIAKLIELQNLQKQNNPLQKIAEQDGQILTMSKAQQKTIIKTFQKQLFSKVMRIKIVKDTKNESNEKKKTRIVEIALEQEKYPDSIQNQNFSLKNQSNEQNRISLIGMYPLPIFNENGKDEEVSFYQNVSVQPLSISLYDTKTGAQEGKLKFQLKKGKVDKEIQTLQTLEDMQGTEREVDVVGEKALEGENLNQLQISKTVRPQNLQKNSSQQKLSKSSLPYFIQSEQPSIRIENFSQIQQPNNRTKSRNENIQESKSIQTNKDSEFIGKIIKNQSSSHIEYHPIEQSPAKNLSRKTLSRKQNKSEPKTKQVPMLLQTSEDNTNFFEKQTAIKTFHQPSKNSNTHVGPPHCPSQIENLPQTQSQASYRNLKQQFMETANLLQQMKLKAQQYIGKVQSERKTITKQDSENEGLSNVDHLKQTNLGSALSIQRKMIHLEVNSFVVNQIVLAKKKNSRNQAYRDSIQRTSNNILNDPKSKHPQKKLSVNKNRNLRNSPSPQVPNNRLPKKTQSPHKLLKYKEQSEYHFTEEDETNIADNRRTRNIGPIKALKQKSNRKIYKVDVVGDSSNEQEEGSLKKLISLKNGQSYAPFRSVGRKLQESAVSEFCAQQFIQIKVYSLKIKILSLPLVTKHLNPKGKEYYVLVYTDFSQKNGSDDEMIPPVAKKCIRHKQSKNDELQVIFGDENNDEPTSKGFLTLKGIESTKFHIQLYESTQKPHPLNNQSSLQQISLITLSPSHKRQTNKTFASLSVSFIELVAQQESRNDMVAFNKTGQNVVTYTNFLYSENKIVGKININYLTVLVNGSDSDDGEGYGHNQVSVLPVRRGQRKQTIGQLHPSKKAIVNGRDIYQKHLGGNNQRDIRRQRSESGMTKKLTPKLKKETYKSHVISQSDQPSYPQQQISSNQADPLQILKRRLPKPIKTQEKPRNHSQSYVIRFNRPYHTPTDKGKQLYESLNSSLSVNLEGGRARPRKNNKDSGLSSNHFQNQPAALQSPTNKAPTNSHSQLTQLRQKKQEKKLKKLQAYHDTSHPPVPQTDETRISHNKRYDGGNIKFGKSSRFSSSDSPQMSRKGSKQEFPGPGHYQVRSVFDRHTVKEP